jgi:hypothetical protein
MNNTSAFRTLIIAFFFLAPYFKTIGQSHGIEQFRWLEGTWKAKTGDRIFYECWKMVDAQTMTGYDYFIQEGDTVISELIMIREIFNYWTYIAVGPNDVPVLFTLQRPEEDIWTFENTEHDYPQQVVYSRKGETSILAWINGSVDGLQKKQEFIMEKIE